MEKLLLTLLALFPFAAYSGVTSEWFCQQMIRRFRQIREVERARFRHANGFPARRNQSSDALVEYYDVVRGRG